MAFLLELDLTAFGDAPAGESGVTPGDAGQEAETQVASARDMDAEFEGLIKGEYKDQYDKRMADTIQKRLKSTKDTVDKYNKALPVLEAMAKKYGIKDAGDIDALVKAFDEDATYLEEEAMERGVTVEQLKEIKAIEKENKALRAEMEARETEEKAKKQYAQWFKEADEAKKYFPSFDLKEELNNEEFRGLLNAGVNVKTAFQVVHQDEIFPAAMQYASQKATERAVNAVRANGLRPAENGSSAQSTSTTRVDVSTFTKEQRDELIRRAERGERITLS